MGYQSINKKQLAKDFKSMKNMAELRALSQYSLENPLSTIQYNRIMELKRSLFK